MTSGDQLGVIVEGSLSAGLTAKLATPELVEQMRVGKFVVVEGDQNRYFSLVTDVQLHTTDERVQASPPTNAYVRKVLAGATTYSTMLVSPMLMLARSRDGQEEPKPQPVRTIPTHFVPVLEADENDFGNVFGKESTDQPTHFNVGQPLDNDVWIPLDLSRFIERSNGVFGKSGTGKSFLTRVILAGIIKKDVCSNLIFDMHNEYGWESRSETSASGRAKGLKQLFPGKVKIFTLDPESDKARAVRADAVVRINAAEITPEDIALLASELNLTATAPETAYLLDRQYGRKWINRLIDMQAADTEAVAEEIGAHKGALQALRRKLMPLTKKKFLDFGAAGQSRADAAASADSSEDLWEELGDTHATAQSGQSSVRLILDAIDRGEHVVLEFGAYDDLLSYLLVANILTRRIREAYVTKVTHAMAAGPDSPRPRPLMITIEEAHKFLDPAVAGNTTFGTLAREMRKYSVSLLVVDQRPSAIESEVLSQIGTRICCLLDDEKDVDAILSGVNGASKLRSILATLESRGQALLLGHALPMPVVVRTREYDDLFYAQMSGFASQAESLARTKSLMSRFGRP